STPVYGSNSPIWTAGAWANESSSADASNTRQTSAIVYRLMVTPLAGERTSLTRLDRAHLSFKRRALGLERVTRPDGAEEPVGVWSSGDRAEQHVVRALFTDRHGAGAPNERALHFDECDGHGAHRDVSLLRRVADG